MPQGDALGCCSSSLSGLFFHSKTPTFMLKNPKVESVVKNHHQVFENKRA